MFKTFLFIAAKYLSPVNTQPFLKTVLTLSQRTYTAKLRYVSLGFIIKLGVFLVI